jgi:multimeric flavodoxin WrbA
MKVTAFIGGGRKKKYTHYATEQFLKKLQSLGDIECEIVNLSDYQLETCIGCCTCFSKGEEFCPFKDDRDKLFEKINNSNGIIFATPNYSFNVSGRMKIFLDRLGFYFHRPHFFGKTFTGIVIEGIYGGNKIVDYFNFIGRGLGFNVVKGSRLKVLDPITEKNKQEMDKIIDKHSKRFYSRLIEEQYPAPTIIRLMMFRAARTSMKLMLSEKDKDYKYYSENGWFDSDYYYPIKLNPLKKVTGRFFDIMSAHSAKSNKVF